MLSTINNTFAAFALNVLFPTVRLSLATFVACSFSARVKVTLCCLATGSGVTVADAGGAADAARGRLGLDLLVIVVKSVSEFDMSLVDAFSSTAAFFGLGIPRSAELEAS